MSSFWFLSRTPRGFTLVELIVVVMIVGILASVALTSFQGYTLRSKTAEAPLALNKIVDGEVEYFHKNQTFLAAGPTNLPPTPVGPTPIDFSTDPRWALIGFSLGPISYFGYQVDLIASNNANCEAMADLDGNGTASLFRRNISVSNATDILASGVTVFDELE